MFSVEYRDRVTDLLIEEARLDSRIAAAAAVGGSAGTPDRWSDIDLTLGVAADHTVEAVLHEWTASVCNRFDAVVLFDLPLRTSIYRVFLLPGALQVDLSFTPAAEFGALGSRFRLLFGESVSRTPGSPPGPRDVFGLGVHHAVRAQICLHRGLFWQAEYLIHGVRDQALALACHRNGLETGHGRGFDRLPREVLDSMADTLVRDLSAEELGRALAAATSGLLNQAGDELIASAPWFRAELELLGN